MAKNLKKENGKQEYLRLSDTQALDIKFFCRRYNDVIAIDWITNSSDNHNYNLNNSKQTTHTKQKNDIYGIRFRFTTCNAWKGVQQMQPVAQHTD